MLFSPHHGDSEQAWLMSDLRITIKAESHFPTSKQWGMRDCTGLLRVGEGW